jgi:hypothetical protein
LFQACKGCIGTYKCDCTGIRGLPGEPGIFGLRGSEGLPGDIGLEGPLGTKGEKGAAGEDGGTGEKGYRVSIRYSSYNRMLKLGFILYPQMRSIMLLC